MRISKIEFIPLAAPATGGKKYGMSKLLVGGRQTTLVTVELEDGSQGFGEAWGIPQVNLAYLDLLKGYLVGTPVWAAEHVFDSIFARHYHFSVQGALTGCLSGIDIACKDAHAKALGVPVYQLLGGRPMSRVPAYASGGYLSATPDEDLDPQLKAMAEAGYPAIKIKIGLSPENDEKRCARAREILGNDVKILADINSNYTLDIARQSIERLYKHNIGWVEEPLSPQDVGGLSELRARSSLPLATGEALYTVHDFKRLVDARAVDVLQPDLTLAGGFWQGRKIAELAYASHLRVSPHVWGGAIGLAAALHFIPTLSIYPHGDNVPEPILLEYDLANNPLRTEIIHEDLSLTDGAVAIPQGPGLGVTINWDAVEKYAVR
jgi:D-galactarolactone cycloisomerase